MVRCGFKRGRALFIFFAAPSSLVMYIKAVFYVCSSIIILIASNTYDNQQYQTQRRNFKMHSRLALIMDLIWVIGSIAALNGIAIMWRILNIYNNLHGVFIFLCFTCSSKVQKIFERQTVQSSKRAIIFRSLGFYRILLPYK
ncbi:g-protein coupled receptor Mth2 [Nephila pilipes]|uniref:G-protein coupled receptor Mth2 n=1 Tax=Nephila pilipes TaxID=299642 RepID=A0A8X6PT12_NEPPI|nr:g-protein coupled receptor Mth2 [Nephila pilipes]